MIRLAKGVSTPQGTVVERGTTRVGLEYATIMLINGYPDLITWMQALGKVDLKLHDYQERRGELTGTFEGRLTLYWKEIGNDQAAPTD